MALAEVYRSIGDHALAFIHADKAVSLRRSHLGDNHVDYYKALTVRGSVLRDRIDDLQTALNGLERELGRDNLATIDAQHELAESLRLARHYDKSIPLFEDAASRRERLLGPEHIETLKSLQGLAAAMQARGTSAAKTRALLIEQRVWEGAKRSLGAGHLFTIQVQSNLGGLMSVTGNAEEAEQLLRDAVQRLSDAFGDSHQCVTSAKSNLALALAALGRDTEVEQVFESVLASAGAMKDPQFSDHAVKYANWLTLRGKTTRATEVYQLRKEFDDAHQIRVRESAMSPNGIAGEKKNR